MYHIVMIDECEKVQNIICDAEPQYVSVACAEEAHEETKKFIGKKVILTHFWGTWEGKRIMFMCYDMFIPSLKPNKQATIAYLGECFPGTMHVIFGPVVGLLDPELW